MLMRIETLNVCPRGVGQARLAIARDRLERLSMACAENVVSSSKSSHRDHKEISIIKLSVFCGYPFLTDMSAAPNFLGSLTFSFFSVARPRYVLHPQIARRPSSRWDSWREDSPSFVFPIARTSSRICLDRGLGSAYRYGMRSAPRASAAFVAKVERKLQNWPDHRAGPFFLLGTGFKFRFVESDWEPASANRSTAALDSLSAQQ